MNYDKTLKKFVCFFVSVIVLGGCASYHPMPLTQKAVAERIAPPDLESIRIQAESIEHPILKPIPFDYRNGLSPDEAAILAVIANPMLRAARDKKEIASAQILKAGILPNPELSYNFEVPTGGDTAGRVNGFGLGLSWDIASLISRNSKVSEAKARKEAVDLDIAWQEWQVAQAAKADVYQVVVLQNQIALAEQACQRMAQNLAQIQKAVADGSMIANALNTVQAAKSQANANLLNLEKKADQQRLQLNRLMGLPADTQIRLSRNINLTSQAELPTVATLLKGLEQRRLDLLALRRGYDSQEEAVRVAIMEQFPRISIGPTISRDTDNIKKTGFGLSIEMPVFNRNQGKITRQRATRQKLFDEYANRVFEAHSDIELLLSRIRFTNEQIAAAQTAETDLEGQVENYSAALADGRTDALTYYMAWNDLVSAHMKVLALQGQLAQAVVALQLETGFYKIPKPSQSLTTPATEPKEGKTP